MSGEGLICTISDGDSSADINRCGGGIIRAIKGGQRFIDGYPEEAARNQPYCAGILLAPWPNRTEDATFDFAGDSYQLMVTEPQRRCALHGFVGSATWEIVDHSQSHVTLELPATTHPGWPWELAYRVTWTVDRNRGVDCVCQVHNRSDSVAPFGFGWHPFIRVGAASIDDCQLELPTWSQLPLDPVRNLPQGSVEPCERTLDLNGADLDHCFGPVESTHTNGCVEARLRAIRGESAGQTVTVWGDEQFRWFQVCTTCPEETVPVPEGGRCIAVEPMTCPPNALRSGTDLMTLAPRQTRTLRCGVRVN